jgi:two-component system, LytTR family, response regulator
VHAEHRPAPIRAVIVDDEPLARSSLTVLLRRDPAIELVAECGSGAEALTAIRNTKPNLIFLDVEMPECDGFDILESLGVDIPPAVIFVTAYDKYAIRAFETGALDYLLKPFDDARFDRAIARAKERIGQNQSAPKTAGSFVVRSAGHIAFLKLAQIDWIEAADYYSRVHIGTKTHLLRRSLSELDAELDPSAFCRIHRSAIVKVDRVCGLEINASGEYDVLLDTGSRLRLSRRYRKHLQSLLNVRRSG